jgi:Uncharacterized conserved protein (DUF2304).
MNFKLQFFMVLISLIILVGIVELVRRKKLKEEYSLLWLITGCVLLLLALSEKILFGITNFFGAALPSNILFFFGLIFVILLCLHYSLKISQMTTQIKNLAQKMALLEDDLKKEIEKRSN